MNNKHAFDGFFGKKLINFVFVAGLVFGSFSHAIQGQPEDDKRAALYAALIQDLKVQSNQQLSSMLSELTRLKVVVSLNEAKNII